MAKSAHVGPNEVGLTKLVRYMEVTLVKGTFFLIFIIKITYLLFYLRETLVLETWWTG